MASHTIEGCLLEFTPVLYDKTNYLRYTQWGALSFEAHAVLITFLLSLRMSMFIEEKTSKVIRKWEGTDICCMCPMCTHINR